MPRSSWSTKAAGGQPSGTSRSGSNTRPARSRARSPRSKPRLRRSQHRPMWARSRLLARSATAISASRARGDATIRALSPGSTASPRACRPSPRPRRRANDDLSLFASAWVGSSPGRPNARSRLLGLVKKRGNSLRCAALIRRTIQMKSPEPDVAARDETAIEPAVEVAEIDVEILGLQTDIADEAHFEPGAHSPAGVADAAARQARPGGVDVAQREPAGEVRQEAIEPIAQPSARRGQPLVAGLAAGSAKHRGGRLDARPVDVAFGTDDSASELPVVTDGCADEAARYVEGVHAVPLGTTPAAAAVDTDIEAGPGVDRIIGRSRLVIARQIGGGGRPSRQRQ